MISYKSELSSNALELAGRLLETPAAALHISRLTGDASTRAYYRARSESKSLIVSLYKEPFDETERAAARLRRLEESDPAARLTYANDPRAHLEVTALFVEGGLPVPRVLGVSGADRILIFEDVGDVRLQDWLADRSPSEIHLAYKRAVELIVAIQNATDIAIESKSICSAIAFDSAKLSWELDFFIRNYFGELLAVEIDASVLSGVREELDTLSAELAGFQRVLTHRDYHARNLMMKDGEMFIIDHQDARMGSESYDLASLLNDPYVSLDSDLKSGMIEYFVALKADSPFPLGNRDDFARHFDLMTVQRTLKAIGTYAYQTAVANNSVYRPYIKPAIQSAVEAMGRLRRFKNTRRVIEETAQS